ncbi:MAG: 50S ribosomal protein L22 [Candidatus Pacearchaeota archaeon]|nr:50S ribosomal protein L22 [Candidatus Pacearchaeota archaeon]
MVEEKEERKEKKNEESEATKVTKIASSRGKDLPVSTKQSIAICSFIKVKNPQKALHLLEQVIMKKTAVPMKGEIPHRHNMPKGKVAGRYPVKASKEFIKLLKNLIANASVKGMAIDKLIINKAIANKASRPFRGTRIGFGRKYFKRTHVALEATEMGAVVKRKEKK